MNRKSSLLSSSAVAQTREAHLSPELAVDVTATKPRRRVEKTLKALIASRTGGL